MDTQSPVPQVVECSCKHCRRRWWSPIGSFFRFIGLVILLVLVFVVGLLVGGPGTLGRVATLTDADVLAPGQNVMFGGRLGGGCGLGLVDGGDKYFGVITAVAGQKLTIADNGGGTQSVLVTSETTVLDGEREVPMWKLRTGYSIRIFGDADEGVITADLIEVVR